MNIEQLHILNLNSLDRKVKYFIIIRQANKFHTCHGNTDTQTNSST